MKKTIAHICFFFFVTASFCQGADLSIIQKQGAGENDAAFTILVQNAPQTVKAFSMDIRYDTSVLSYVHYERGSLGAQGYPMFMVHEYKPGVIRVGGIDPLEQGIVQGDTGEFVHLKFKVTGIGDSSLSFGVLKSDIKEWTKANSSFSIDEIPDTKDSEDKESEEDDVAETQGSLSDEPLSEDLQTARYGSEIALEADSEEKTGPLTALETESVHESARPFEITREVISGPVEKSRTKSTNGNSLGKSSSTDQPILSQEEKIQALYGFKPGGKAQGKDIKKKSALFTASKARAGANRTQNARSGAKTSGSAFAFASPEKGQDHIRLLVVTLLVVILVLVVVLLIILTAILVLLTLIYKKLKALEKSGKIIIQGPVVAWSNPQTNKTKSDADSAK